MVKIKFEFTVSTRYVNSTVKDEIEIEVDDDATEKEIEEEAEAAWLEWRNEQCEGGWKRLN